MSHISLGLDSFPTGADPGLAYERPFGTSDRAVDAARPRSAGGGVVAICETVKKQSRHGYLATSASISRSAAVIFRDA